MLAFDGRPELGVDPINRALRLNPQFVNGPYFNMRGAILMFAEDYSGAVQSFEENISRQGPVGSPVLAWIAAAYWALGKRAESKRYVDQLIERFPAFRLTGWNFLTLTRSPEVRQRIHDVMLAAGVPE